MSTIGSDDYLRSGDNNSHQLCARADRYAIANNRMRNLRTFRYEYTITDHALVDRYRILDPRSTDCRASSDMSRWCNRRSAIDKRTIESAHVLRLCCHRRVKLS